ncbi:hypothetical protein GQ600_1638 [Phytophthora cactorum]|nr:hypothetical protein GQ600_7857 [Phytophthora cactorum]KAF1776554.1 hypothetical protein GQ600_1638 [Phytophthora cactorum]
MRLVQVVLSAMIILLASFNCIASVHNSKVAPSDTARKLLSFQDVEPSKQKKHRESNENHRRRRNEEWLPQLEAMPPETTS